MAERKSGDIINTETRRFLDDFVNTRIASTRRVWISAQKVISLYTRDDVDLDTAIAAKVENARAKAAEVEETARIYKEFKKVAEEVVLTGSPAALPSFMVGALFRADEFKMHTVGELFDGNGKDLHGDKMDGARVGYTVTVYKGGQLGLRADFGEVDEETGEVVPTTTARFSLVFAKNIYE